MIVSLVAGCLATGAGTHAQVVNGKAAPAGDGARIVSRKATASARRYRRNEAIPVVIEARNQTNQQLTFDTHGDAHSALSSIDVIDEGGQAMRTTMYSEIRSGGMVATHPIPPGQAVRCTVYLNTLSDMTMPGVDTAKFGLAYSTTGAPRRWFISESKPIVMRVDEADGDNCAVVR